MNKVHNSHAEDRSRRAPRGDRIVPEGGSQGWKALEIRGPRVLLRHRGGNAVQLLPLSGSDRGGSPREDWLEVRERLEPFPAGNSAMENLHITSRELAGFSRRYWRLWASTTAATDPAGEGVIDSELRRIQRDLERIVARAIEGHEAVEGIDAAFLPKFAARALEQWSRDPRTSWKSLSGILGRLIASP